MALAKEGRGPFPEFLGALWDQHGGPPLHNATVTTIAPTGTISILAGASSGIEPLFALAFTRHVLEGRQLQEMHPLLLQTLEQRHLLTPDLLAEVAATRTLASCPGLPADLNALFVTSHELTPEVHMRMQAAFQRRSSASFVLRTNSAAKGLPCSVPGAKAATKRWRWASRIALPKKKRPVGYRLDWNSPANAAIARCEAP
jgi:hypothetical protein